MEYFYGNNPRIEVKHKGNTLIIKPNNTNLTDEEYVKRCIDRKDYEVKKVYRGITGNWVGR
jgi:hypothetical protein